MKNEEILKITGRKPWITHPHTLAQKLDQLWKPFDYLTETSKTLTTEVSKGNARIIFCCHPRVGKTTLAVLYLVIWFLSIWPKKHVIFFTYSEDFALERSRMVRNTIVDFKRYLTIRLSPDSSGAQMFNTIEGGGMRGLGIGSGLAGLPCDLMLIDDIFSSWEKSQNPRERTRVISWIGDVYQRLQPGGSIVVCGARWHIDDLQGFLINKHSDDWTNLTYSAISEGPRKDLLKRPAGAALCPDLFNKTALEKIRQSIGEEKWRAQYLQDPVTQEASDGAEIVFPVEIISKIGESLLPKFDPKDQTPCLQMVSFIAFDPGGRSSHSSILIAQLLETADPDLSEINIVFLRQYPLDTKTRSVAKDIDDFSVNGRFAELCPIIIFDGSGNGGEQAHQLLKDRSLEPLIPITIIASGKGNSTFNVPKINLVENLRNFISDGRLTIVEDLEYSDTLFKELRDYRGKPSPQGRTISYRTTGADGSDDLVDCLSLITWAVMKNWKPRLELSYVGLYGHSSLTRRTSSGNPQERSRISNPKESPLVSFFA